METNDHKSNEMMIYDDLQVIGYLQTYSYCVINGFMMIRWNYDKSGSYDLLLIYIDQSWHSTLSIYSHFIYDWSMINQWCMTIVDDYDYFWLVVWTPLKNISQLGLLFPIYGKIKHVPNHQPDFVCILLIYDLYRNTWAHGCFPSHGAIPK